MKMFKLLLTLSALLLTSELAMAQDGGCYVCGPQGMLCCPGRTKISPIDLSDSYVCGPQGQICDGGSPIRK